MHGSPDRSPLWIRVFGPPILLAALTITGLASALLGGAAGRYIAWLTVGAPVLFLTWTWLRRGLPDRPQPGRKTRRG